MSYLMDIGGSYPSHGAWSSPGWWRSDPGVMPRSVGKWRLGGASSWASKIDGSAGEPLSEVEVQDPRSGEGKRWTAPPSSPFPAPISEIDTRVRGCSFSAFSKFNTAEEGVQMISAIFCTGSKVTGDRMHLTICCCATFDSTVVCYISM